LTYPKSRIITFNLCGNPSLNTRGTELPSLQSNPMSIVHRRRFFPTVILVRCSLPLPLVVTVKKTLQLQHSSLRLPHAIRLGMIIINLHFVQPAILVKFSNRIFFHLQRLNLFPYFRQKFCPIMSFNGHIHCSVYWCETRKYLFEI
jgi:hypothetical protein